MSWDILLLKHQVNLDDPQAADLGPLGSREEIIARLRQLLPSLDCSDPAWGVLDTADFSIEFNRGRNLLTDSLMLHVRGGGNPLAVVQLICAHTNWAAYDCQRGAFVEAASEAQASWARFQQYRNQVLGSEPGVSPQAEES